MRGFGTCLGKNQKQKDLAENEISNKSPEIQSTPVETGEPENPDEQKSRKEIIEDIVKHLENKEVCKVVLHGVEGVGKTWIAREVAKHVTINDIFDFTIWVYVHTNFEDYDSEIHDDSGQRTVVLRDTYRKLYSNILHQLSVQQADLSDTEYLDDSFKDGRSLSDSLIAKLEGRTYLLILDGENKRLDTRLLEDVLNRNILKSANNKESKVLFTTSLNHHTMSINTGETNTRTVTVEVKPLTLSESKDLFKRTWKGDQIQHLSDADIDEIVQGCNYLPASIVFAGNVLMYNLENVSDDFNKKLAVSWAKKGIHGCLMLAYEKFANDSTLFRCVRRLYFYLEAYGFLKYNELILLLMLEGFFENVTSFEKAYSQAHDVLMDLLDAGLLGEREGGDIVLESIAKDFVEKSSRIMSRSIEQEFAYDFNKLKLGGNNVKRTMSSLAAFRGIGKDYFYLVTLIVKGHTSASTAAQLKYKDTFNNKNTLILSFSYVDPIIDLPKLDKLRVLIMRGFHPKDDHIKTIKGMACLRKLQVLEVSDCPSLQVIEQGFFVRIITLEHVNLSGTGFKSFPKLGSIDRYTANERSVKLRTLILRRCNQLESVFDLRGFTELEVLDLSGSKLTSLNFSLEEFRKLKVFDLSDNCLHELPVGIMQLENLTHLLMKNCQQLREIRPLTTLTKLEVIDASGCTSLHYFTEVNLPSGDSLKKIDLSYTMIQNVPPLKNASNLVELCFKGCSQLKELPPIEGAKNLRMLDVSDAIKVEKITESFEDMESLQELLLSNTKIKTLPPLSDLKSLQKVVIRGCEALQTLPDMSMLTNLLLLDVRGCIGLARSIDGAEPLNHAIILNITDPF
ncbi:unnamed protein product [Amaranthus hypochondriacus]